MCTVCPPKFALVIGLIGGCIACGGVELLNKLKIDDPVGVVPVHFFCGVWSLVAAGLFAKQDIDELDDVNHVAYDGLFMVSKMLPVYHPLLFVYYYISLW